MVGRVDKTYVEQAEDLESRAGLSTGGVGTAQVGPSSEMQTQGKLLRFWQRNSFGKKWWRLSLQRQEQDQAMLYSISLCWIWETSNPEVMQELCCGCGEGSWTPAVPGMAAEGCQSVTVSEVG